MPEAKYRFTIQGKLYYGVPSKVCVGCAFQGRDCSHEIDDLKIRPPCGNDEQKEWIIFVEATKVCDGLLGEPLLDDPRHITGV